MPRAGDVARIGVVDMAADCELTIVAETTAWCWQQSCMLQWFPGAPDTTIVYNTVVGDHFGCCVQNLETGEQRVYDTPVYTVSSDGRFGLCPNFARLARKRPGYGYEGPCDPWHDVPASDHDGIYRLDFATGKSELVITLAQIAGLGLDARAADAAHWFNHLLVSPDNTRFIFLHRWSAEPDFAPWRTRLFTAACDGSDICLLNDHDMTSHFIWRDAHTVLAWARRLGRGDHYYLFTDRSDEVRVLAPDKLVTDGHMSYAPGGRWLVTDTYPYREDRKRRLLLFDEQTEDLSELGAFHADPVYDGPARTDLHPRWSRDGKLITFDSIHEGERQIYLVDVGSLCAAH
jgi:hypothetical protein